MWCACRLREKPTAAAATASSVSKLLVLYGFHPATVSSQDLTFNGYINKDATKLLQRFNGVVLEKYNPLATMGDGNCAYRAVPLALFGVQDLHVYVRVLAALKMMSFAQSYDIKSASCVLKDERILTSQYSVLVKGCADCWPLC